jgi:hypothetical protein
VPMRGAGAARCSAYRAVRRVSRSSRLFRRRPWS